MSARAIGLALAAAAGTVLAARALPAVLPWAEGLLDDIPVFDDDEDGAGSPACPGADERYR